MKKKIIAMLTACLLVVSFGTSVHGAIYTSKQLRIADALNHVELFLGTENGYDLDKELTRTQGIVLLIRLLGLEEEALNGEYDMPFSDVAEWAEKYIGYAYENGITRGVSDTKFGASSAMTDYMFLTLVLRALGYSDSGDQPEFSWDSPYKLAKDVGLIASTEADIQFLRCDAIEIFWNALAGNEYELAYDLADRGVYTRDELEECIEIYQYGKIYVNDDDIGFDDDWDDDWEVEWEDYEKPSGSGNVTQSDSSNRNPETSAPENNAPVTNTSGNNAPEANAPENNTPETSAPENNAPENNAPGTNTPENNAPENNTPDANAPENNAPETGVTTVPAGEITYDDYMAMSGEAQQAYFLTYENPADFFTWLNEVKAEYEAQNPSIEIGGNGSIDLGDIIDKENNG